MTPDPLAAILAQYLARDQRVALGELRDPLDVPRLVRAVEIAVAGGTLEAVAAALAGEDHG